MNDYPKIYVYPNANEAYDAKYQFSINHMDSVANIKNRLGMYIVNLVNGEVHIFMSCAHYTPQWFLGRTYYWGDELYHSGEKINKPEVRMNDIR